MVELFGVSGIIGKRKLLSLMCVLLRAMKGVSYFYPVNRGR